MAETLCHVLSQVTTSDWIQILIGVVTIATSLRPQNDRLGRRKRLMRPRLPASTRRALDRLTGRSRPPDGPQRQRWKRP